MCVIIYVPKTATIDREELVDAWRTNPDGAGFSIQRNGKVQMKRGFMDMDEYIEEVLQYIGKYNTMLHFRISTTPQVNKLQTHPYVRSHIGRLQDTTEDEVIAMNGIVSCNYTNRFGWNDTMNFIKDHEETFHIANQDIVDLIEELTGSRWFIMRPNQILASKGFIEKDGKLYSNINHLNKYSVTYSDDYWDWYNDYLDYLDWNKSYNNHDSIDDLNYDETEMTKNWIIRPSDFFSKTLEEELKKEGIWGYILDFMRYECNGSCECNGKCFNELRTKEEIISKMEIDYGIVL